MCFKESVCDTSGDELKILRSHQGEKSAKVPFFVNLCEGGWRGDKAVKMTGGTPHPLRQWQFI